MLMLMLERRKSLFVSLSLTVLMMTLLVGCRTTLPPRPTKPTIEMEKQSDGGVCLDKENTRRLSDYIFRLENWVEDVE